MNHTFSRIVQGCMGWGAWGNQLSIKKMTKALLHSFESGITTFDHADIYGDYTTEKEFGKAFTNSGIDRESIQLISKSGIQYVGNTRNNTLKHYQYDAAYLVWSAENSIKALQASYLDLFLLHRPSPLMHPDEIAKAVDKLTSEGKIKAFGVSNFSPTETALIASKSTVSVNQIECSITAHEAMLNGSLQNMMLQNILPMAWSPLGAVFKEKNEQTQRIHVVLDTLSEKYAATKDQLLLAWLLKHPANIHPVIGSTNPSRITNAVASEAIKLSDSDWFELLVASQGHKVP
ncbi:aldo/keto reductase [Ulvibacter litoralis]|uniref:Predicted oxidoreductase n=1 Tax=Ulvibacter litoralis TaxID=227084 RepID=A0A1G7DGM0_9FLAO|nr:aldo/keto reductase [Ulvibacter litoralis]GHC43549.1 putative oxidoreductase YcsN [Ulvibacter litoralis]SDE50589.1 Predicted oxidoreductase [Ulvibacter litoralis]